MTHAKLANKPSQRAQYTWVGALLGLYNGVFYQPSGNTDIEIAIELAIVAGVVTVMIRSWKKGFPLKKIIKDFFIVVASYLIFMLSLAFRKAAYDFGGKTLVIVESVAGGAILGLLLSWRGQVFGEGSK